MNTGKRIQERVTQKGVAPGLVVGLAAVLVTAGALALQATPPAPEDTAAVEPASVALTRADMACPAAVPNGQKDLALARVPGDSGGGKDAEGTLEVRQADQEKASSLDLPPDGVTTLPGTKAPVVVSGKGASAPGLFGARFGSTDAPAAGECTTPAGERWFVGVGAGGLHESKLLLANPDGGPAVADLTIWSTTGELQQVESRGLTIPAGRSSEIDLAELVPQREELAVQLTVSRGRVAATTQDSYEPAGAEISSDWMPWTAEPATEQVIPGLPQKADENTLVLVNPGADEGRVTLKVRGAESEFAPSGLKEIRVPAGRVVVTTITDQLKQAISAEDTSLSLSSDVPVSATLRTVVNGDLAHLPAVNPIEGTSSAVVGPTGGQQLVLSGTQRAGVASVRFLGEGGEREVGKEQVRLRPGTTSPLGVPDGARGVVVDASVPYAGSLRSVVDGGVALLPLRELQTERLIPDVTPAWP